MNSGALALLLAGCGASLLAWTGEVRRRLTLVFLARPLVMISFIGAALAVTASSGVARGMVVAALGASLVGEVVLATPDARLRPAVVAFMVSRGLFIAALWQAPTFDIAALVSAAALIIGLGFGAVPQLLAGARSDSSTATIAAIGWAVISSALVLVAASTLNPVAIVGAVLVWGHDALFGWVRLVGPVERSATLLTIGSHAGHLAMVMWLTA